MVIYQVQTRMLRAQNSYHYILIYEYNQTD